MSNIQYPDKRVQRTTIDFYHALFELLEHKDYSEITVTDIISQARYSRSTFYKHYEQKDDLLYEFIDLLLEEMVDAYRISYKNDEAIHIQELVDEPLQFLRHFKQCGKYYQTLLSSRVHIDFRNIITQRIVALYLKEFEIMDQVHNKKVDGDLYNRYTAHGLIGLILEWITDDFPIEPEQFSDKLVQVFQYSMSSLRVRK